jgi:hypothetical protein
MRLTTKKIFLIAAAACLALPILAFAASTTTYDATNTGLNATAGAAQINTSTDVPTLIGTVIKAGLGLVGMIFLGLMVYAGVVWMIARGDESKTTKAKDTIIAAIIGLVIVVGAYAITNFVVNSFAQQPAGASLKADGASCTSDAECKGGNCGENGSGDMVCG